jgi:hypothetical protein
MAAPFSLKERYLERVKIPGSKFGSRFIGKSGLTRLLTQVSLIALCACINDVTYSTEDLRR